VGNEGGTSRDLLPSCFERSSIFEVFTGQRAWCVVPRGLWEYTSISDVVYVNVNVQVIYLQMPSFFLIKSVKGKKRVAARSKSRSPK